MNMKKLINGSAVAGVMLLTTTATQAALTLTNGDFSANNFNYNTTGQIFRPTTGTWYIPSASAHGFVYSVAQQDVRWVGTQDRLRGLSYFFNDNSETTGTITLEFDYTSQDVSSGIAIGFFGYNTETAGFATTGGATNTLSATMEYNHTCDSCTSTLLATHFFTQSVSSPSVVHYSHDFDLGSTSYQNIGMLVLVQGYSASDSIVFDNFAITGDSSVPDTDGDGVPDGPDMCPGTVSGADVDTNGCSDAQVDADGDGYCDPDAPSSGISGCTGTDNCPMLYNPDQIDVNLDGHGDACVSPNSTIPDNTDIGSNPTIGDSVQLNDSVVIGDDAVLGDNSTVNQNVVVGDSADIGSDVTLGQNIDAGDNLTVGEGSSLNKGSSLGNDVELGTNVTLGKDCMIGSNVQIGDNTLIGQRCVIEDNVVIGANVVMGQDVLVHEGAVIPDGTNVPARSEVF